MLSENVYVDLYSCSCGDEPVQVATVTAGEPTTQDVHVVAVIDTSFTMTGVRTEAVKSTLRSICNHVTEQSTISIAAFNSTVRIVARKQCPKDCLQAIDSNFRCEGSADLQAGLEAGIQLLDDLPRASRRCLFVFTDGHTTRSKVSTDAFVEKFEDMWKPYGDAVNLWFCSTSSGSDSLLVQSLAEVVPTSMVTVVLEDNYSMMSHGAGNFIASCQSSWHGHLTVADTVLPFRVPALGENVYLFTEKENISLYASETGGGKILVAAKGCDGGRMCGLVRLLRLKNEILKKLTDTQNPRPSDPFVDYAFAQAAAIRDFYASSEQNEQDTFARQCKIVDSMLNDLALLKSSDPALTLYLTAGAIVTRHQSSSEYTQRVGNLFRSEQDALLPLPPIFERK